MTNVLPIAQAHFDALKCDQLTLAPFRSLIIGPKAALHRYTASAEKDTINLGAYASQFDTTYLWPGRTVGSTLDLDYVKVWLEDVYLNYFNDYVGLNNTIAQVAGYGNRVRSSGTTFKSFTNSAGTAYPRSATLYDRDVAVDDVVYLSATVAGTLYDLWTTVTGFVSEVVAASIGSATGDSANKATQSLSVSSGQITGTPANDINMSANGSAYTSLVDGYITRTYTITVTQSSTGENATTARLSVTSSDGGDNQSSVTPAAFGSATSIGTKGLTVTFSKAADSARQAAAVAAGIAPDDLVVGQQWTVTVNQAFTAPTATSGGTYTGAQDADYIIRVSRGGQVPTVDTPSAAPTAGSATAGGALAAGTYYAKYTLVNANGETTPSPVSASFTTASSNLTIALTMANLATELATGATSANVYLSTASNGTFYLYKSGVATSPTSLAVAYDDTTATAPTTNTCFVTARVGAEPQLTVTTTTGVDSSGPTNVIAKNQSVTIGNNGVTLSFNQNKLRKGDVYYVSADAQNSGAIQTLETAHDLPSQFTGITSVTISNGGSGYSTAPTVAFTGGGGTGAAGTAVLSSDAVASVTITNPGTGYTSAPTVSFTGGGGTGAAGTAVRVTDLSLRLFINQPLVKLEEVNTGNSATNWTASDTYLTVKSNVKLYDDTWTNSGVQMLLPVYSATVFGEFREWIYDQAGQILSFTDISQIEGFLGEVDPDNPVSYGVFKALSNTPGATLLSAPAGAAVLNTVNAIVLANEPTDTDSWSDALVLAEATDGLYNIVPMTKDATVQNLVVEHVAAQSDVSIGLRRACILSPQIDNSVVIVNATTTTDLEVALATVVQDPATTSTSYTYLRVTGGNAQFITNGVARNDVVRYQYTLDALGNSVWAEYLVDAVLSEDALRLRSGPSSAITTLQKVEVWRNLSKDQVVTKLKTKSASYFNDRVQLVWPDKATVAGVEVEGYYVAAALAGLLGSIPSHQAATNTQLIGFDTVPRSTSFLTQSHMNQLTNAGIVVVSQTSTGELYIRRDVTTNTSSLAKFEGMVRRNIDMVAYALLAGWSRYFGYCNNTTQTLQAINNSMFTIVGALKAVNNIDRLGPPLYSVTTKTMRPHPTLADRIQVELIVNGPYPLNGIELTITV